MNKLLYWFTALWRLARSFGSFIGRGIINLFKLLKKPTTWIILLSFGVVITFIAGLSEDRNRWLWYTASLILFAGLVSLFSEFCVKNKLIKVLLTFVFLIASGVAINVITSYFYDAQCEKHLNFVLERIDDSPNALSIVDLKKALECAYRDEDKAKILTRLAEAHFESRSFEGLYEALQEARHALGIYESLSLEDPKRFLPQKAHLHCFLGDLYDEVGYLSRAFEEIKEALSIYKAFSNNDEDKYKNNIAKCYLIYGVILSKLGR